MKDRYDDDKPLFFTLENNTDDDPSSSLDLEMYKTQSE